MSAELLWIKLLVFNSLSRISCIWASLVERLQYFGSTVSSSSITSGVVHRQILLRWSLSWLTIKFLIWGLCLLVCLGNVVKNWIGLLRPFFTLRFVAFVVAIWKLSLQLLHIKRDFDRAKHVKRLITCRRLPLLLKFQLIVLCDKHRHVENLLCSWPFLWIHLKQLRQDCSQVRRVVGWYFWIDSFHDTVIKTLHVLCGEGRVQSDKLVKNRTQWPNVWLVVVRLVLPDFRRSVVRCSCLCL